MLTFCSAVGERFFRVILNLFILLLSSLLFKAVNTYSWLFDLFNFIIMSQFYLVEEILLYDF